MNQSGIVEAGMIALVAVMRDVEWIFRQCPPGDDWLKSDGSVQETLARVCHNQAQAFTCLFYRGARNEAAEMKRIRENRLAMVRSACAGSDISELVNKSARNALAHFDERYAQILKKNGPGVWMQDLMLGTARHFPADTVNRDHFIRVYIHDEKAMILFGEELRLDLLLQQAADVLSRLTMEHARRLGMWVDP